MVTRESNVYSVNLLSEKYKLIAGKGSFIGKMSCDSKF